MTFSSDRVRRQCPNLTYRTTYRVTVSSNTSRTDNWVNPPSLYGAADHAPERVDMAKAIKEQYAQQGRHWGPHSDYLPKYDESRGTVSQIVQL